MFFSSQCREWLTGEGKVPTPARAEAIERSARELLQIVVIDLAANENAQEIFETLNARGAVLTAADLIKNFVFQKLLEQGSDVESAYSKYWAQFETAFWEQEVSTGRVKQPRSSVFLNHWLIARTGEEVVAREVFARFKAYADFQSKKDMSELLKEIHQSAGIYRTFTEAAEVLEGPVDRTALFAYRARTLESEVVKPVILAMLDHKDGPPPSTELEAALDVLESWIARRMLVRATSKSYNKIMADVIKAIHQDETRQPGKVIRSYFSAQQSDNAYWPDDEELRSELLSLPIYRKLSRARVRMVLEAIEDHRRGWSKGRTSPAGVRIRRGTYAIEHVMPQSWSKNWPLEEGVTESEREKRIHTLGNLTLLSKKLNSTVSNSAWVGEHGKASHLQAHDVLLLNSSLIAACKDRWNEADIDDRTLAMTNAIIEIWPVPEGHKSVARRQESVVSTYVEIADLLSAGFIASGQTLYSKHGKYAGRIGTILSDGRIDVDGQIFSTPSGAGAHVRQKATNGWGFWLVDQSTRKSLRDVRREYLDQLAIENAETDGEEDDSD